MCEPFFRGPLLFSLLGFKVFFSLSFLRGGWVGEELKHDIIRTFPQASQVAPITSTPKKIMLIPGNCQTKGEL